ncbi:MAG: DUF429 domain-containing protein [Blastochloris sp.]|nr:DUF429 domain-containing protein [Blastochloris sp.]
MWIIGIDLAWGEKKADGVCIFKASRKRLRLECLAYPQGDEALLKLLMPLMQEDGGSLVALDAPVICVNETGSRPVDREMHRLLENNMPDAIL